VPNRVGCIVLGITALVIVLIGFIIAWSLVYPSLLGGLTESDIPLLKSRAFDACQEEAWDIYGVGARFDANEADYDRRRHNVRMDVWIGGRPMECSVWFETDAPQVVRDANIIRRQ